MEPITITHTKAGQLTELVVCLEGGAPVDAADDHGATALHYACYDQQAAIVDVLLRHGADPTTPDPHFGADAVGWLDQSVFDGRGPGTQVARRLIESGCAVDASRAVVFDLPDLLGDLVAADPALLTERPLLHDALYLDRPVCVRVLLHAGADPSATFPGLDDEDYHVPASTFAAQLGREALLASA